MHKKHLIGLACAGALLVPSLDANARISKKLGEELTGYITSLSGESDKEAQQAALLAKGLVEGSKGRKALAERKADDDKGVRLAAGLALYATGDRKALDFLEQELVADAALLKTLEERVSVLDDKDEARLLEKLLKTGKPDVRVAVARYASTQKGKLFDVFEDMLTEKKGDLRRPAVQAAIFNRVPAALKAAKKLVGSKDKSARVDGVEIAIALSERAGGSKDAEALLEKATKDKTAKVATAAARRLVELRNPAGTATLLQSLNTTEESGDRQETMRFLLENEVRPKMADIQKFLAAEDAEEKALAHELAATTRDPAFLKKLLELERSENFEERLLGIRGLGRSGSDEATKVLTRTLFEGRVDVRLATAKGLVNLGKAGALGALQKAVRGERDPKVKLHVIDALGSIKSAAALQQLRFLVTDRNPEIKKMTLRSIRRIGLPEGASTLDVLMRDRDLEIQWNAFLTALELKPEMGLSQIDRALRNPRDGYLEDLAKLPANTRAKVFENLITKRFDSQQSDAIKFAMRRGGFDDLLLTAMADAKTAYGDRRALMLYFANAHDAKGIAVIERLVRTAPDKPTKRLAAWLLTRFDDKNLEPSYRGALGASDPALKAIATYGIAVIHD